MGQKNNVWNHYFRDKERFADLFNGVYFQGKPVIRGVSLTEISGVYDETIAQRDSEALVQRKECYAF